MHSDILILKERADRLEAILATGQQVDARELEVLAHDIGMDAMSASSAGPDVHGILAAMRRLIEETVENKAK
eukprot:10066557-Karenia_brevis.AAC.1